jgi:hypothetical protein
MSDITNFSDEQLDTQTDFDQWEPAPEFAPPPPAATYRMYVSSVRDIAEKDSAKGKRIFATLDLRIQGGQFDDRAVNFQRVNNVEFQRRDGHKTSFMLDLLKSAGVQQAPRSNKEFAVALQGLADRGPSASFSAQLDWEGVCSTCRDKSLMATTNQTDIQVAKNVAQKDDWDKARTASMKFKNYRAFPTNGNGTKNDSPICSECGESIRAQVNIKRFTP